MNAESLPCGERVHTLHKTKMSHLGERKIICQSAFFGGGHVSSQEGIPYQLTFESMILQILFVRVGYGLTYLLFWRGNHFQDESYQKRCINTFRSQFFFLPSNPLVGIPLPKVLEPTPIDATPGEANDNSSGEAPETLCRRPGEKKIKGQLGAPLMYVWAPFHGNLLCFLVILEIFSHI